MQDERYRQKLSWCALDEGEREGWVASIMVRAVMGRHAGGRGRSPASRSWLFHEQM